MINLELTIDRIENDKAVLLTQEQETIIWPKNNLPQDSKEGDVLHFSIKGLNEKSQTNQEAAKDILNEILDIEPSS